MRGGTDAISTFLNGSERRPFSRRGGCLDDGQRRGLIPDRGYPGRADVGMVDSPWKSIGTLEPGREYLALLSYLPLEGYRKIVNMMRRSRAVSKQLANTPGLVGFTFRAKLLRHRFWTLSAWEDERALMTFVGKAPHLDAMTVLQQHMGETAFVRWRVRGADLPLRWDEALRRMPASRP